MAKSKLTQAKEITDKTKRIVLDRQHNRSISGVALQKGYTDFHHVIFRSSSGVGYEWNVVAITSDEHRCYHDGNDIVVNGRVRYTNEEFETLMKNHLKIEYPNWTEEKCKYKKYYEMKDYEIYRRNYGKKITNK